MSTLKVTNIQDTSGGNSSTTEEIFEGRAKAWVNFNGMNTVAIRDSYNVSSITDNGTGDYTINFTNAMSNNDYAAAGTVSNTQTSDWSIDYSGVSRGSQGWHQDGTEEPTTTTFRINSYYNASANGNGAASDYTQLTAIFYN